MKIYLRKGLQVYEGVELCDIVMLTADSNYTKVVTITKTFTYSKPLKEIFSKIQEKDIAHDLVRINRSTVVNRNHVTGINGNQLMIRDEWFTISRDRHDEIFNYFTLI